MDIFRTLGSGSLSVTAMLDFSGKASTSIHGLGEDDTASITPDNKLFTVKYAFNLETLIDIETYISQITYIFTHLKLLCVAVARHNIKWLKIYIEYLSALRDNTRWVSLTHIFNRHTLRDQPRAQCPTDTRRCINAGFTLVQRRRRWSNVKPTLIQLLNSDWWTSKQKCVKCRFSKQKLSVQKYSSRATNFASYLNRRYNICPHV